MKMCMVLMMVGMFITTAYGAEKKQDEAAKTATAASEKEKRPKPTIKITVASLSSDKINKEKAESPSDTTDVVQEEDGGRLYSHAAWKPKQDKA